MGISSVLVILLPSMIEIRKYSDTYGGHHLLIKIQQQTNTHTNANFRNNESWKINRKALQIKCQNLSRFLIIKNDTHSLHQY